MKKKIRIGAVNYLNTKPLIYGFMNGEMKDEIELVLDYPSKIAGMLIKYEIDIGLVPVVIISEMKEHYIISDYCIGCDGEVASVCLFSDVPLEKIEKILLDYQSKTSIELLKMLIKYHWKINPILITTTEEYNTDIQTTTAGLIIGDRALEQREKWKYRYDLGLEWKKFTGLPFVFATWVANKAIDPSFIEKFNNTNKTGLKEINKVVAQEPYHNFDLQYYLANSISYDLSKSKKEAMKLFLEMTNKINHTLKLQ